MPRVNKVEHARKDYPEFGIKKGEAYYWWKFRFGGKRVSKTYPKPSQLTMSEFLSSVYDINERLEQFSASSPSDAREQIEELVSEINDLASEQEDKLSNMPDGLQQGSTGELLQSRAEALQDLASNLENIDTDDVEREEGESEEDFNERFAAKTEEINSEVSQMSYEGE